MPAQRDAGVAEAPPARDRRHGVDGRIGRLKIAVRPVEAETPQVLQRRRAQMAPEHVLHRARADADGGRDIAQPDVALGIVVNKRDRPAQLRRLRRIRARHIDVVQHWRLGIPEFEPPKQRRHSPRLTRSPP